MPQPIISHGSTKMALVGPAPNQFREPLQIFQVNASADTVLNTTGVDITGCTKTYTVVGANSMWTCYGIACCEDKIGTTTQPFTASFWLDIVLDGNQQLGSPAFPSTPASTGIEAFIAFNTDKNCTNGATYTTNMVAQAMGTVAAGSHTWKLNARYADASIVSEVETVLGTYTTMILMIWDA